MTTFTLENKVALVTGGARGIGLETARILHAKGASVVLLDVSEAAAREAAQQVGERTLVIGADVSDAGAMSAAVAATVERFGGLDLPIANAGVAPPAATMRVMDADAWERVVDIDLLGVWRTVRPALDQVVARRGHVVVISSVYAWVNGMLASPYAVSKAGVEALGRALRAELAVHGASAQVAHFGFVDTGMVHDAIDNDPVGGGLDDYLPAFMSRRITGAQAAAALVEGIERRAARTVVPKWWKAYFAMRGVANPVLDALATRDSRIAAVIRSGDGEERASDRGGVAKVEAEQAAGP